MYARTHTIRIELTFIMFYFSSPASASSCPSVYLLHSKLQLLVQVDAGAKLLLPKIPNSLFVFDSCSDVGFNFRNFRLLFACSLSIKCVTFNLFFRFFRLFFFWQPSKNTKHLQIHAGIKN